MTRIGLYRIALVASALLACLPAAPAAVTNATPDFKETYELIRSHLPGVTEADLDRAVLDGLLSGFTGRVVLEGTPSGTPTNAPLTSRAGVLEDGIAFIRVGRVADGLAQQLGAVLDSLKATNQLKGLVLDLRFAGGTDYAAAAAAANLFITREKLLLDWTDGSARSQVKTNALTLPVAVLVNHATSGAAEALAAVLRESGSGLLLGETTAGLAMVMQDFTLKDGRRLRIATKPVKLGDGTELSTRGVKADIEVAVAPDAGRIWFEDAYAAVGPTNAGVTEIRLSAETNRPSRRRLSEADLVRERREGAAGDDDEKLVRAPGPEKLLIRDPVLARAVDLLKALALVQGTRN